MGIELQELGGRYLLAILVDEERITVGVESGCLIGEECAHRITFTARIGGVLSHGFLNHLVLVVTDVEVGGPVEILGMDVSGAQGNLHTLVVHARPVDGGRRESTLQRQHLQTDEVGAVAIVVVYREGDGIVQYGEIDSGVHVLRLLPFQVRVRSGLAVDDVLAGARQDGALLQYTYQIR